MSLKARQLGAIESEATLDLTYSTYLCLVLVLVLQSYFVSSHEEGCWDRFFLKMTDLVPFRISNPLYLCLTT